MKAMHFLATILLTAFICLTLQAQHQHKQETQVEKSQPAAKEVYTCSMHPEVVSDKPGKCPKCGMKLEKKTTSGEPSPSNMMGKPHWDKPTFERSVDGINVQVWLITQEEHKKIMKERMTSPEEKGEMKGMDHDGMMHGKGMMGMKHDGKEMSTETIDAMMAGTHHLMLMATDEATKKEIENVKVEINLTSPSKKMSTIELKSMKNHNGGGLSLEEKGTYQLLATAKVGEKSYTAQFDYEVK